MGASKNRLARMQKAHPRCIFCGGDRPTTSIEHMPSRAVFDQKQRPRGLEFPSCQVCQNSTRREELLISLLSRTYPDAQTPETRKETRELIASAKRNFPGLMSETLTDRLPILWRLGDAAKNLPTWNFIDLSGPICSSAFRNFAVKLAKALHFELTGEIVPNGAGILHRLHPNLDAMTNGMPEVLMDALGEERSLAMGTWHSYGTFSYQSAAIPGTKQSAHMTYFRQSFALFMLVYSDPAEIDDDAREYIHIT